MPDLIVTDENNESYVGSLNQQTNGFIPNLNLDIDSLNNEIFKEKKVYTCKKAEGKIQDVIYLNSQLDEEFRKY